MKPAYVDAYLNDTRSVEGWLFPVDAHLIGVVDEIQDREQIRGNLFEIGVHHGKSAILLAGFVRGQETLGVCDVFDAQSLNVDHSGEGSLGLFLSNMKRFAPAVAPAVRIHSKPSSELLVGDTTTGCRLFHIDGGHRPADVLNDLNVAVRALGSGGVVVVDDVFNPSWPGVGEGVHKFLCDDGYALVPMIIGGNKVFFTREDALPLYAPWLERLRSGQFLALPAYVFEHKEWYGRSVLTASRRQWVELSPIAAAGLHYRGGLLGKLLLRLFLH